MRRDGINPAERTRARRRALQAMYQWQMTHQRMQDIIHQFMEEQDMGIADLEYFKDLLLGVERLEHELDAQLTPFMERPMQQVDQIERAVLRIAAYELMHRADVPYRVVINEAIEVTKQFGSDQGHTYVNGVLDKAAVHWRAAEVSAGR